MDMLHKQQVKFHGGMQFVSELNKDWYINSEGEAINTTIANEIIKSGEIVTLKLVLTKNVANNGEVIENTAEIRDTYNKYGIEEIKRTDIQSSKAKSASIVINQDNSNQIIEMLVISISIIVIMSFIGVRLYKQLYKHLMK